MLHIGRNDAGKVVGVEKPKKLLEDLPNKTRDALGILVDVHLRREDGKSFLEIVVEPQNISLHLKALYEDYEIDEGATCKDYLQVQNFRTTALDGKRYERNTICYN